jgi:hypothetical protein
MLYARPRMGTIFYILGSAGLVAAPVTAIVGTVLWVQTQGFGKDELQTSLLVALAFFVSSLLILGMASLLNVLHDVRAELSRANQLQAIHSARAPAPPAPAPPPPANPPIPFRTLGPFERV